MNEMNSRPMSAPMHENQNQVPCTNCETNELSTCARLTIERTEIANSTSLWVGLVIAHIYIAITVGLKCPMASPTYEQIQRILISRLIELLSMFRVHEDAKA